MAASMESATSTQCLKLLFESLNHLISPVVSKTSISDDTSEELLHSVLQNNLATFQQLLRDSKELQNELGSYSALLLQDMGKSFLGSNIVPIRQKFTEVCICLLHHVNCHLMKAVSSANKDTNIGSSDCSKNIHRAENVVPELPPDALSIQQEKAISAALQFIVVLGVCPYLVPGVGIPVSQRLGPAKILLATAYDYSTELNDLSRIQHLVPVIKLLCSMLEVPSLKDIVLNSCLSDLLAVLLQVRYCVRVIMQRKEAQQDIAPTRQDSDTCLKHIQHDLEGSHSQQSSSAQQNQAKMRDTVQCKSKPTEYSSTDPGGIQIYFHQELPEMYLDPFGKSWTLQSVADYCSVEIDRAIRLSAVPHVLTQLLLLSGSSKANSGIPVITPVWFRRAVAGILRDVIKAPPGIQHLITLFVGDCKGSTQDWHKCKAVAQIISRCPVTSSNAKQFYTSVSRQLIELLLAPETKVSPYALRAVGEAVLELTNQQPELMEEVCLGHLLSPLRRLSSENVDSLHLKEGQILLSEETITQCISCSHRLFVLGQEPQSSLVSSLRKVIGVLFSIYVFARKGVSTVKSLSSDLIKTYLNHCDTDQTVRCLMSLASSSSDVHNEYPAMSDNVFLQPGPDGGLLAVFVEDKLWNMDSWTEPVDSIVDILSSLNSDTVISELFLNLLQRLTDMVSSESSYTELLLPARVLSPAQQAERLSELREKVSLVSLIASVGEKFGEQVIQCGHHVLTFVKATLERSVKICQSSPDDATLSFEWETVSMALGLLTAILSGALELTDADKKLLDDLLPLLTAIGGSDVADQSVREMADDLRVAVATRGLVWAEISKVRSKKMDKDNKKPELRKPDHGRQTKPLIEVLSETSAAESQEETLVMDEELDSTQPSECKTNSDSKMATVGKIEKALQDLCDPLLPVRGHGLISLARLVEDRDPEVRGKQEMLLKIFMENLTHTDSYIYLASVNGLAALSDLCPDQVVPCLTSEFRSKCIKCQGSKPVETVLKVGESVVKTTRRLGELAPNYRNLLLPVVLCGCRHEDALVRASSLSGLADVCKLLRFSLGPVLHEVITCCRDIMKSDPDPEPRKAATLTLKLLLQGLGKDVILTLGDVLLDVYRVLKHSLASDPDDKVRLNANLALAELDDIMREALFAKPELKKTITILGYQ